MQDILRLLLKKDTKRYDISRSCIFNDAYREDQKSSIEKEKKMFDSLKKMFEKNAKTISLKAVEDGRTIPMDEVNDQTFAQELLGPGIAIVPSNGTVVSPINGTIATVMDTKHAVCIQEKTD